MKVYRGLNEFSKCDYAVVTSGFFDGVHKGHQKILSRIVEAAKDSKGESVVITFWPHPKKILSQTQQDIQILSTLEEKIQLIESCGIDHFIIIPFTKEFSQITSDEFVQDILLKTIGTKKLIIGYDHKFGKNREGSFEYLKENTSTFGFEVEEIPRQDIDNIAINSTLIRKALLEGKVKDAATYLGRNYSISGTVVKGKQLGAKLGYPTANIKPEDSQKIIPKDGIYAVTIKYHDTFYKGMLSIGFNPTVHGTEKTIEVNIFDFNKSIYEEDLEVFFIEYLREEEKFNNLEELIVQLRKDKEQSLNLFK